MDDTEKSLLDYLDILRRRKLYIIVAFPLLLALSATITFLLPPIYQSEGVVLIESQEIPRDLVRSTVTSYAEQQIQVIKQRILTTSRILETLDKYNVYKDQREIQHCISIGGEISQLGFCRDDQCQCDRSDKGQGTASQYCF